MEKIRFPKDFIFGTATSAAQLEGAAGGWQGAVDLGCLFPDTRQYSGWFHPGKRL